MTKTMNLVLIILCIISIILDIYLIFFDIKYLNNLIFKIIILLYLLKLR